MIWYVISVLTIEFRLVDDHKNVLAHPIWQFRMNREYDRLPAGRGASNGMEGPFRFTDRVVLRAPTLRSRKMDGL
jgi:hypothetical protein